MAMIEFSQEWKSGFPIDTVFKAPLLLSKGTSESFIAYNRLQFLKCPHDDTVVVFLTTGTNLDRVGFLLLSVKDKSLVATGDQKGGIFTANKSLGSKIVRVLVNPIEEDDSFLNGNYSFSGSFGYFPIVLISIFRGTKLKVSWGDEARIGMFSAYALSENERFLAMSRAVSDSLHFALVSETMLIICDVRKPMVLSFFWGHFGIVNSASFSMDHPFLLGDDCQCGDCLVREQFWKEALPEWTDWQQKKDMVLGFGVLSNDLSSLLFEPDEFGGFALIRLMSSGKLESQRYCASWELAKNIEVAQRDPMPHSEDNLLYFMGDEEYKFPRKFKYFELNYLHAYLNGNLSQVLDSNMAKPCEYPHEKESFSLEFHEVLCEKLKICGFGRFRTSPAITVTFNDINLPTSIHEVALRRMWAELPTEFLQLAFSSYSDLHEVLLDQKRVTLEFSVVPELPQLPPFFLRKPSNRSNRWSRKVQSGDALVGPVLPLPILSTLHELLNGCPNSQEETGGFSSESELRVQCNEVMQVAKEVAVSDSTTKLQDDNAVSLDDDGDDFLGHSEKPKSFLLYHPAACHLSFEVHKEDNSVYQDDKFASMITKVHDKQSPHPEKVEAFKLEYFDDLCPITLKFDDHGLIFFFFFSQGLVLLILDPMNTAGKQ
ncbi:hypothetical protein OIU76_000880 [Salix suchowensis]|nr:hypothetical protein OIU76_000880 [Salix suchowensis]